MPAQLSVPAAGLPPHPPAHLCPLSGTGQETKTELPRLAGKRHRHHGQGLRVRGPLPAPRERGLAVGTPKRPQHRGPAAVPVHPVGLPVEPLGRSLRGEGFTQVLGEICRSDGRCDAPAHFLASCFPAFLQPVCITPSLTPPQHPELRNKVGTSAPGQRWDLGAAAQCGGLFSLPPPRSARAPLPCAGPQRHVLHRCILTAPFWHGERDEGRGPAPPSSTNPTGCHPQGCGRGGRVVPHRKRRRGHVAVAFPRGFTPRPVWPQHRHRSRSP